MSEINIDKLTPEQEALIPVYQEKWRSIALSTEPIDRQKATEAVKKAYALIGLSEPEILFYDSPYGLGSDRQLVIHEDRIYGNLYKPKRIFKEDFTSHLLSSLTTWADKILSQLRSKLEDKMLGELVYSLEYELYNIIYPTMEQVWHQLWDELESQNEHLNTLYDELLSAQLDTLTPNEQDDTLLNHLSNELDNLSQQEYQLQIIFGNDDIFIHSYDLISYASLSEFCINVLNLQDKHIEGEVLQEIAKNCSCIFPFEKLAIVCDRPRILCFDNQQRLHAEGQPAIQFADGYSIYAYHGVRLPEKYGTLHPHQWQASWLLEEDNVELRRVLIQGIGYDRIAQELGSTELD